MIEFRGNNFSEIYLEMLENALYGPNSLVNSRIGSMKDLGPASIEIIGDGPILPYLKERSLNPYFALAEFSWIITGSNLLAPLRFFINNYEQYSDDGITLNGAYGYRLINYFNLNQIEKSIEILKSDEDSRRVVLSLWSPKDLGVISKDIPCNINILLKIRNNKLDLTVVNRSNDLYLGIPYNIFLFHLLHKYLCYRINIGIGIQRHFTNCLHIYQRDIKKAELIIRSNTKQYLKKVETQLSFDVVDYINIDHKAITNLEFSKLAYPFNKFFKSLIYFKNEDYKECLNSLPSNLLGYVSYLWLTDRKNWPKDLKLDFFENIKEDNVVSSDFLTIQIIKNESVDTIIDFVHSMVEKHSSKYEILLNTINKKNSIYEINIKEISQEKVLESVILSLILASVSSNIMNPYIKDQYVQNITSICQKLNLQYSDLLKLLEYENKFLQILDLNNN